jgi:hypothetical protein
LNDYNSIIMIIDVAKIRGKEIERERERKKRKALNMLPYSIIIKLEVGIIVITRYYWHIIGLRVNGRQTTTTTMYIQLFHSVREKIARIKASIT